jgi:cell wall-associated NlpC family hydrolase
MSVAAWAEGYIGLPFQEHGRTRDGLDCWGLAILVYREQLGIHLPSYETDYSDTLATQEISAIVVREKRRDWRPVPPGSERVGDIVLFRLHGAASHVGIVIGGNRFLHVHQEIDSIHEDYGSLRWGKRVEGFWRFTDE